MRNTFHTDGLSVLLRGGRKTPANDFIKNGALLVWIFLLLSIAFPGYSLAQEVPAELAREKCVSGLQSVTAESALSLNVKSTIETCTKTPLDGDLSIQILHYLLGEPVETALKTFYMFADGTSSVGISQNSVSTVMYPLHKTLEMFNWFFFGMLCITLSNHVFAQVLKWTAIDNRMTFAKWMKLNGGSSFTTLFLSIPLFGWMTPLQFLSISIVVLMTYVAKTVVAYLFFASFFSQISVDIAREIKPEVKAAMQETTMIYYCDLQEREKLINGIMASESIHTQRELESVGLFSCLTSGNESAVVKKTASDPYNAVLQVTLPAIMNTQQCWLKHESEGLRMGLAKPSVCGSVSMNLPRSDVNVDTSSLEQSATAIYLNPSVQNASRNVAIQMHEYVCRKDLSEKELPVGAKDAGCSKSELSGSGYRYSWLPDDTSGELVLFRYHQPMSSLAKSQSLDSIARSIGALSSNLMNDSKALITHFDLMMQSASDSQSEVSQINKGDASDLAVRIERGGWLAGSLFFKNISESMDDSTQIARLAKVYVAESSVSKMSEMSAFAQDKAGECWGELANCVSKFAGNLLFPRLDLFQAQTECWNTPSTCQPSALNPFIEMGRQGTQLIAESTLYYMGAKVVNFGSSALYPIKGRGKLMISDTLSGVYVLYMLIGFSLAFLIPAYPLFMLMGILISWAYDVLLSLLSLQVAIAQSPISEHRDSMFSEKVQEAGLQLLGLAGYFIAVMLGVLMTFFSFSFFYGMNGLIIGWLSGLVGWAGEAHAMEGIVLNVIKDVVMTFILFYEVKLCVPFIQRIPQSYLDKFKMHMTDNEHVAEMMIRSVRNNLLPGVAEFISNGKAKIMKGW